MRKKMIEVAIPLDAINRESAREKSIRHGHPSTLHLWWARRPLAACRAVIFTSLVDDPDSDPANRNSDGSLNTLLAQTRRAELFAVIEDLVKWESIRDEDVLGRARAEIASSVASAKVHDTHEWSLHQVICGEAVQRFIERKASADSVRAFLAEHAPPVLDPFCGGGSIPLEAQRLGLRAIGTDLNPVPILITKALIEVPSAYRGRPPVNPDTQKVQTDKPKRGKQISFAQREWRGAEGLADDVRYYGTWMRQEAERRLGSLYPPVHVTPELAQGRPELTAYIGQDLPVIAWLWCRTVPSPNPAAGGQAIPLIRSYWLCSKKGKEAWIEPIISGDRKSYRFELRLGPPPAGVDPKKGTVVRTGGTCILTEQPVAFDHIRGCGKAGQMSAALLSVVAETPKGRVYFGPLAEHAAVAAVTAPADVPDTPLPEQALSCRVMLYGMDRHWKLFSSRQLTFLSILASLVSEARQKVASDATEAGFPDAEKYANAVATYLGEAASKTTAFHCTLATWRAKESKSARAFGRQSLPMTWDYAEVNPFADAGGAFDELIESAFKTISLLPAEPDGTARQHNATMPREAITAVVSTDPPYYDNVGYADLSDFYYVWLRRALEPIHPDLFRTVLTPKAEELIATPYRHDGSRAAACAFFESGMRQAFSRIREIGVPECPVTVYYAFKQSESESSEGEDSEEDEDSSSAVSSTASTGWETMLEGMLGAGFTITGTWPLNTESTVGLKNVVNALASSIVLVCRPREPSAPVISRRDFVNALKRELPAALKGLQSGNIAPVDLAQAAIGPGMAVYSRYSKVLESSGERLTVRTALALINQVLDEVLAEQEGDYDADTRWSLKWFEQFAHDDGPFGDANTLATAMSIGINGLVETGIVQAKAGKVRLLKRTELMSGHPETWDPATDTDIVHWEVCQYLIHALDTTGEAGAAALLRRINARYPGAAETARELAYRLYTICERKKWAQEAMAYNSLIVAWPEIVKLAQSSDGSGGEAQTTMF